MAAEVAKLEDLLPIVARDLPKCPEPAQFAALIDAWREFCQDTEAWREKLKPLDLTAGKTTYRLISEHQAIIHNVVRVWLRTSTDVARGDSGRLLHEEEYDFNEEQDNSLSLTLRSAPASDVTSGLVVQVIYFPLVGTFEPIGFMFNRWGQAIADKAITSLASEQGRPYFNPAIAARKASDYGDAFGRARRNNITQGKRSAGLEA